MSLETVERRVPPIRWEKRRGWPTIIGTYCVVGLVAGVALFAVMPTILHLFIGGFVPRERFASLSPDGRYRVRVTSRVEFPANEPLDPSAWVTAILTEAASGKELDSIGFALWEISDVGDPKADWSTPGQVKVSDLHDRKDLTVTLMVQKREN